jgi:hypothetical protein
MRKPTWNNQVDPDTTSTPVGTWTSGVWADWVVHVAWRPDSSGMLQVWKGTDPNPVFQFSGQNKFDDGQGNYMKFGIYKWDWASGPTQTTERVIYYDELRIADQSGSRQAVSPPAEVPAPRPAGCFSRLVMPFRR